MIKKIIIHSCKECIYLKQNLFNKFSCAVFPIDIPKFVIVRNEVSNLCELDSN
jgi:hypothetical protein